MAEPGWVYLVHPETGGSGYFPNSPDVLELHAAKGWEPGEEPVDDESAPETEDQTDDEAADETEPSAPATKKPSTAKAVKPATDKKE